MLHATMRPRCVVSALAALTLAAGLHAQAPASSPVPGSADDVRAFADSLVVCKSAKVATAHPLVGSFVIEHSIAGDKDATCAYAQTMPGKMTMECAFSPAARKLMAAELRATAAGGPMRGGTSQAQPEWARECELVTASGARTPMVRVK
jgi:hypothetical protein